MSTPVHDNEPITCYASLYYQRGPQVARSPGFELENRICGIPLPVNLELSPMQSVHFIRPEFGSTLLEISMKEGVASWLSFVTRSDVAENGNPETLPWHQCLFWSQEQFRTATGMQAALINEFEKVRDRSDSRTIQQYLYLDVKAESLPDAPSRTGYFVGLVAVRAWAAQYPEKSVADILEVSPEELWQALLNRQSGSN